MKQRYTHKPLLIKYTLWCVVFCSFVICAINAWVIRYAQPFTVSSIDQLSWTVQVALVLWAKVYSDGRVSHAVQERADTAIALRKEKKVEKILISWDNRTKRYDEVTTIKKYVLHHWVPASVVFLDYAWLDTYDSMYRAQYIFNVQSMIIPTQDFHVGRAVYIARALGIDARWVITDTFLLPNSRWLYTRELWARVKAYSDVLFHSLPHHLGEKVPLTWKSNSE